MIERDADAQSEARALAARHREHFSLPAEFYRSDRVYRADLEHIFFRSWIYAGHVSQLAEPGCYFVVEFAGESVIVVRDTTGEVRVLANVCRHRGSRICTETSGKVKVFVCPYHAWTYELDGRLRSRRSMPAVFEQSGYSLKPIRAAIFHGLIFINLDPGAPDLVQHLSDVDPSYSVYDLSNAKVALQRTFSVEANWKLAIENFMECYHCAPAHAEYSRFHALKSPKDNEKLRPGMLERAEQLGYSTASIDNACPTSDETVQYFYVRNALYPPHVSGSRDGASAAPLLGRIKGYDGGAADVQIGPVSYGILYADHAVLYRFLPQDVQKTDMEIIWLVGKDAREGIDYDLDNLAWLWTVTTEADERIILNNQRGVNSRFYEPGPLSEMETFTRDFIRWYLSRVAR